MNIQYIQTLGGFTPCITILAKTADTPRKLGYNTWLMRIKSK